MSDLIRSDGRRSAPKAMRAISSIVAALAMQSVSALEVTAGDYEVYPAGVNILPLYYQHAERSDLYVNGKKVADDFRVKSDIGLIRYIRPVELSPSVFLDPQVILPFGEVRGGGAASVLGKASGTADLILGAPVKFLLDPTTRDALSIGTFLYLPTGDYDNHRSLNLGDNRWKALLQLAYVKHFNANWALDVVGDVMVHGKNNNFGPANAKQELRPRYEAQAHVRYNLSPATSLSAGYGYFRGAESTVNGVAQNDKLKTQYVRLTAAHFINQTLQLQAQLGKDVSVENGPREKGRLNLRMVKIF